MCRHFVTQSFPFNPFPSLVGGDVRRALGVLQRSNRVSYVPLLRSPVPPQRPGVSHRPPPTADLLPPQRSPHPPLRPRQHRPRPATHTHTSPQRTAQVGREEGSVCVCVIEGSNEDPLGPSMSRKCVCVCVCLQNVHSSVYQKYVCVYMCVCVCMPASVCV